MFWISQDMLKAPTLTAKLLKEELNYNIYIYISKYLVTDARHKKKEIINFCISGDGVLTSEKETIRERRERT